MNISPDDFEKLGIDESNLDEKAEQTTYKIRYVARYVRQWVRIEANRKEIQQINFIDCMCNAGVYKDGDACTALEVIEDFNGLAKQFPSKKFVVYLNDIDKERIKIFEKIYFTSKKFEFASAFKEQGCQRLFGYDCSRLPK